MGVFDYVSLIMTSDNTDREPKRGQYPCCPLEKCIKVAEVVRDLGGNRQPVSRDLIARQLGAEKSSPTFIQVLGSVKCFGLIESENKEVKLSSFALELFYPTDASQRRHALLKAISWPKVYEKLVQRFDGNRIPPPDMLANILHRELDVSHSWAPRVGAWFITAVRMVDALDEQGILRYQAAMLDHCDDPKPEAPPALSDEFRIASQASDADAPTLHQHTLFLDASKARRFTFTGPLEVTRAEYDRLCRWLGVTMIVKETQENQG